jgi:hypothetical protein
MLKRINGLADRMLARAVPHVTASAQCAPSEFYRYQCGTGHREYAQACQRHENCTITCGGPWVWDGQMC